MDKKVDRQSEKFLSDRPSLSHFVPISALAFSDWITGGNICEDDEAWRTIGGVAPQSKHIKTDSGEKLKKCNQCQYSSLTTDNLRRQTHIVDMLKKWLRGWTRLLQWGWSGKANYGGGTITELLTPAPHCKGLSGQGRGGKPKIWSNVMNLSICKQLCCDS